MGAASRQGKLLVYRTLPAGRRREIVARILRRQGEHCRLTGSDLYGALLRAASADVEAAGPCWRVLAGNEAPWGSFALRLMGSVHRLVLAGRAPGLAPYYPSVSPEPLRGDAWPAFRAAVEEHAAELRRLVRDPVQTNEVGRCAVLVLGFLLVARETGLPLRLLELGASGGLNLRWDRYHYRAGSIEWGDPGSPVQLAEAFPGDVELLETPAEVAERGGCDLAPVDVATPEGVLTLKSYLWADQVERFRILDGALRVAAEVPAPVERAGAASWLARRLERPAPGLATVVFHSYVQQYLGPLTAWRLGRTLAGGARRAAADAPLAWLRFEPDGLRGALRLSLWPAGREVTIATATDVGGDIRWLLD